MTPQVAFPGVAFVSAMEFDAHCTETQARMDARYLYERSLATAEPALVRAGSCAACLRPTRFTAPTAHGEALPDGRTVPPWRDGQICGCEDRLGNRSRALLHLSGIIAARRPWSRLLLFGPPASTDRRLAGLARETTVVTRLSPAEGGHRLDAPSGSFSAAVSCETLHRVPPLDTALGELRRVLAPGGSLLFTIPFRYRSAQSGSRLDRLPLIEGRLPAEVASEVHEIGWDILDRLRAAGFCRALAHVYWSDELGYLGPFNFLLRAVA